MLLTILPLFFLGFASSLVSGLILVFSFGDNKEIPFSFSIIFFIIGFFFILASIIKKDNKTLSLLLAFTAVFDVIGGVEEIIIRFSHFKNENFVDLFVIDLFITAASFLPLTFLWPIVTQIAFKDVLESAKISKERERMLYVFTGMLSPFLISFVYLFFSRMDNQIIISKIISYLVIAWFLSGIVSVLDGIIILSKSKLADEPDVKATPKITSKYDKINV